MRSHQSFHHITATDLRSGGGADRGLYVARDGQVGFNLASTQFYFTDAATFVAWLFKLNALAADTPCVVEAMAPAVGPVFAVTDVPAEALADYGRYCDQLATFSPDVVPATLAVWWERYADDYGGVTSMPMAVGVRMCSAESDDFEAGPYICTRPVGHGGAHAAHTDADEPPVYVWAARS